MVGARAGILQPGARVLRSRARGIIRGPDLGDQPVGTQVREKAHSPLPSQAAPCTHPARPRDRSRGCEADAGLSAAGAMLRWSRVNNMAPDSPDRVDYATALTVARVPAPYASILGLVRFSYDC